MGLGSRVGVKTSTKNPGDLAPGDFFQRFVSVIFGLEYSQRFKDTVACKIEMMCYKQDHIS